MAHLVLPTPTSTSHTFQAFNATYAALADIPLGSLAGPTKWTNTGYPPQLHAPGHPNAGQPVYAVPAKWMPSIGRGYFGRAWTGNIRDLSTGLLVSASLPRRIGFTISNSMGQNILFGLPSKWSDFDQVHMYYAPIDMNTLPSRNVTITELMNPFRGDQRLEMLTYNPTTFGWWAKTWPMMKFETTRAQWSRVPDFMGRQTKHMDMWVELSDAGYNALKGKSMAFQPFVVYGTNATWLGAALGVPFSIYVPEGQ
jgi:hypothetical protein